MKTLKKALLLGSLAAMVPVFAMAQTTTPTPMWTGTSNIIGFLNNIASLLFTIFFIVAIIMLIWAAFLYLTAGGDEEKVGKAKQSVIYAVIAIIVALLAASVTPIVQTFLTSGV